MTIIQTTEKTEIRRIQVRISLGKEYKKPYLKKISSQKRAGGVALEHEALSSNPSAAKKKPKKQN
jgi:hypothetical protein